MAQSKAGSREPARVAAHLIVGPREEPFLAALCASLAGVCSRLIVNDNAPDPSPHHTVLQATSFAREGRLHVDRTPFTDFACARNVCLRIHRELDAGDWVAFVDADEVHGTRAARIAANLSHVPSAIAVIDGYTWHFFQSFDRYMSIERRMMFFRFSSVLRWEGAVHERLEGLAGGRLALPYVYAHYGWVIPARLHAEKGRLYSQLGAPGRIVGAGDLGDVNAETYFEFDGRWQDALRFGGTHPPAARETIARLQRERAMEFRRCRELFARRRTPLRRARNALRKVNYEMRWRGRALNPLARRLLA